MLAPGIEPLSVDQLILKLDSPDAQVRLMGVQELEKLGPKAKSAVPALARLLKDSSVQVRRASLTTLRAIGPDAVPAVSQLVEALSDDDAPVWSGAREILVSIGKPAIAAVTKVLTQKKDEHVHVLAIGILGEIGPDANAAIPTLLPLLESKSLVVRLHAGKAIVHINPKHDAPIATLVDALQLPDNHEGLRFMAAEALALTGSKGKPAIPVLIKTIKTSKDRHRPTRAAFCLWKLGPEVKDSAPTLKELIAESGGFAQILLAGALVTFEPKNANARRILFDSFDDLKTLLKADNDTSAVFAADVLGRLGPDAANAVPELTACLKAKTPALRETSRQALEKINQK
jgi:HEAT repeat protein